jgi:hypothetical protein
MAETFEHNSQCDGNRDGPFCASRGGGLFLGCVYAATPMDETLYDGPAHEAAFYVPTAGMGRFVLSPAGASAYVRSRKGSSLARVRSKDRLFLTTGEHVLILYDTKLAAHVSIVLTRD